jgi:hypothetical protein
MGAKHTQNREERQQERGWFRNRGWIDASNGLTMRWHSQISEAATSQVGGSDFTHSKGVAWRQRASHGKPVRLTKRIACGIAGGDRREGRVAGCATDIIAT